MAQVADESVRRAQQTDALAPLRIPVFRSVWIASTLSNLGGLIQSVGASWMMTSISGSADMVALVQASIALPIVMLSLFAGAMADNLDRRKVMLVAQCFMLSVSVALTTCAWNGWITPWLLLSFTFLIGCGAAFNASAWQASVGDMVPRPQLVGAVALNSMGFNIARSVGPAIGGAIVAAAGAAAAFTVNAATYLPLIFVLTRWRPAPTPNLLPRETLGVAIAAGIRYVWMSPTIRRVLVRSMAYGFGASGVLALLPLVARDVIAGGPLTYGLLLGAFGVGAVGGALGSARLRQAFVTERIVRGSCIAFASAAVVIGLSGHLLASMAALSIAGAAWVLTLSLFNVTVQLSAPRWVVARALSLYQMVTFAGMAMGSWLWGNLAVHQGVNVSLLAAAVAILACAAIGIWRPLAPAQDLNLDPLALWKEPVTVVPVQPRTGPVVIAIEYIIREEDILEFLRAMEQRRRIRRRDGAHHWTLLRDLANPQLWIERYDTATWLDYVRHNSRLTQEDAVIPERLHALHQGPGAPVVRRLIERRTDSLPASASNDLSDPTTDPTRST